MHVNFPFEYGILYIQIKSLTIYQILGNIFVCRAISFWKNIKENVKSVSHSDHPSLTYQDAI